MNIRKNMTITFALAALALGMTTTKASAQPVLKGSFDLPGATYFGDTLLQAGHYTIWMSTEVRDAAYTQQIHVAGEGIAKTVLATSKAIRESGRTSLQLATMGGAYVLSSVDTGTLGRSYAIGATKKVRSQMQLAKAGPNLVIPVNTSAAF